MSKYYRRVSKNVQCKLYSQNQGKKRKEKGKFQNQKSIQKVDLLISNLSFDDSDKMIPKRR